MMMRLEEKVVLISGAASGIGQATALLFASEGARLALADIDASNGGKTQDLILEQGGEAIFVQGDLADPSAAQRVVQQTISAFGRLDVLHNNAGILVLGTILECSEEQWDRIMAVNLKSAFLLSKYAVPEMIKSGRGSIINTASVGGLVGAERASAYAASKGGLIQLTRSMALDFGPHGIRVNCVCPGATETPMLRHVLEEESQGKSIEIMRELYRQARPLRTLGTPEDIAHAVLYLASDESRFVTGTCLVVDGGTTAM